jgi:hypothetical protein
MPMPIYRAGRFRFNSTWLISTEDLAGDAQAAMKVSMFPGDKHELTRGEADELGRKLDEDDAGDEASPTIGGAVLASFDPETGRPLVGPGVKDVPGA